MIIPQNTDLYRSFQGLATQKRMVFFAGLPGVGKSLLLQQLALMAHEAGRTIHLLQWDVTRAAFETDALLAHYPEIDGVTHAVIRKAVGMWARVSVNQWRALYSSPDHMLIGEVPLIGNRLIELAQIYPDDVEPLLISDQTQFVIPIPSREVRRVIEASRAHTIAQPQHAREAADAPPNVLRALWNDVYMLALQLNLVTEASMSEISYDPDIYAAVFRHLLQHRPTKVLTIDTLLPAGGSVYDLNVIASELTASLSEVSQVMSSLISDNTEAQIVAAVERWYHI